MATLEQINYHPHKILSTSNSCELIKLKNKSIENLPQIFWKNGSSWVEANLWALDLAIKKDIKTVHSNMSHLLAYAKWLETELIDWWYFPERESERCLVRFRGYLIAARNNEKIAPSTTSQRMATVIRFYKWMKVHQLISSQWPMWEQRFVDIKLINSFGLEHTMKIASTNLSIPNRKISGSSPLEDGLLPVSISGMKQIITFANDVASEELALMLRIGFFTGLRIGSITDLKIQTLYNAIDFPGTGWKRLEVGPAARPMVSTKFNVSGFIIIPSELLDILINYSMSTRRLKRQILASPENRDILFLTRYGNPYSSQNNRSVNVEMSRLRKIAKKQSIQVFNGFYFHRTRSSFATELMRVALNFMPMGDAIQFVKESCLHKDDSTTMKYIKFIETNKIMSDAANTFSSLFMGINDDNC